ncbi:MAG: hypothetical protein AAGU11_09395 [Syntrophobacteraceae bacterium]
MKKCIVFLLVALIAGAPAVVFAAEDRYGSGKLRTADPNTFIDLGTRVFTYPDPGESTYESAKKSEEQQKEKMNKKVDDAIDRAWGKK